MKKILLFLFLTISLLSAQVIPSGGNATTIQGRPISPTLPADTNVLCWSVGGATWLPCSAGASGSAANGTFTGDVAKPDGSLVTTIQPGVVTNSKMAAGAAVANGAAPATYPTFTGLWYSGTRTSVPLYAFKRTSMANVNYFQEGLYVRHDAMLGGVYNGSSQTLFPGITSEGVHYTQGQFPQFNGYTRALGIGVAIAFNSIVKGWGGHITLGTGYPNLGAGEFNLMTGDTIPELTVTGTPSAGATTISYTDVVYGLDLGARSILNKNVTVVGTGTPRAITGFTLNGGGANHDVFTTSGLDWTTLGWDVVGSFLTLGSQRDLYAPTAGLCDAGTDDVVIGPGTLNEVSWITAAEIAKRPNGMCVGHRYRISAKTANSLTIEGNYDGIHLVTSWGALPFLVTQGTIATDVDVVAKTITLPANAFTWTNGDTLYSPPDPLSQPKGPIYSFFPGYKTGGTTSYTWGHYLNNATTHPMDYAYRVAGPFDTFFRSDYAGTSKVGIDLSMTAFSDAAIKLQNQSIITGDQLMFPGRVAYGTTAPPSWQFELHTAGGALAGFGNAVALIGNVSGGSSALIGYDPGTSDAVYGVAGYISGDTFVTSNTGTWTKQFRMTPAGHFAFLSGPGQHITPQAANNDLAGQITITAATSAAKTFTTNYASAPVCVLTPAADPTAVGVYWATSTTSTVTANVKTSGSIVFNYVCFGNPN